MSAERVPRPPTPDAHQVEHDLDPADDAERFDALPVYGPPAQIPDVCAHAHTMTFADGETVCRDCGQVIDWLRG